MYKFLVVLMGLLTPVLASAHNFEAPPVLSAEEIAEIMANRRPEASCDLTLWPGLPRTETKSWPNEIHEAAGFIVRPGQMIPEMNSDFFLVQLWRTGDLAFVPRYNWMRFALDGKGVNTHEAFDHLFKVIYGIPIEDNVIASGETRTAFGEFFYVNNKSGKRMGPGETLEPLRLVMEARGAIFSADTEWHAVDRSTRGGRGHQYEDNIYNCWQLALRIQVLGELEGAQFVTIIERLGRVLRPLAGSAEKVGDLFGQAVRGPGVGLDRFTILDPLMTATTTDSIYHSIQSGWWNIASGRTDPEKSAKIVGPLLIDRLMERLSSRLTDADRAILLDIRRDFTFLPMRQPDPAGEQRLRFVARPPELDLEKPHAH